MPPNHQNAADDGERACEATRKPFTEAEYRSEAACGRDRRDARLCGVESIGALSALTTRGGYSVSNDQVALARHVGIAPVGVSLAVATLYHTYLMMPLPSWVDLTQMRMAGLVGALVFGALSTRWVRGTSSIVLASTLGVVVGGTWTEFSMPNDMRPTMCEALLMWGKVLGSDAVSFAIATGLAAGLARRSQADDSEHGSGR